jgi:hypothetical protein
MHREHPSVLLVGVQCNVHVMQVTPPSFVCKPEHLLVLFVKVKCYMHMTQALTTCLCTSCWSTMQCACDAGLQHRFMHLKQESVLRAGVSCTVHVTQTLNAALCPIARDICCMLEYNVEAHIVETWVQ